MEVAEEGGGTESNFMTSATLRVARVHMMEALQSLQEKSVRLG